MPRVHAGGDDALNLHALACKGVLLVAVIIVGSDAPGVPQGVGGLGNAWRPQSRRGRCAAKAHVEPVPRPAGRPGSVRRLRHTRSRSAKA